MAEMTWREQLPLLQKNDPIAQGNVYKMFSGSVFFRLLQYSRGVNSNRGVPVPDGELQDLVWELTLEAFRAAFAEISAFDPEKGSLWTFVYWKGRSAWKRIVGSEIYRAAKFGKYGLKGGAEIEYSEDLLAPSAEDPEAALIAGETRALQRVAIGSILLAMPEDQRRAIVVAFVLTPPGSSHTGAVADNLGRSWDAAESLLRRAVAQFRARWNQLPDKP